jgi:hypothetical protein
MSYHGRQQSSPFDMFSFVFDFGFFIFLFFAEGGLWLCNKCTVISFPWNTTGSRETDINVGKSKPSSKLPHSMNVAQIF